MINETNYFNDIENIFEYLDNKKITYSLVNHYNTDFIILKCGIIFRNNKKNKKNNKWDLVILKPTKSTGYIRISLTDTDKNKSLKTGIHRLIYLAFNQNWNINISSQNNAIDHINHNKTYNAYSNLRLVNNRENMFNLSNPKGYYLENNKYRATIRTKDKRISLGYFKTKGEAHFAYLIAKKKYHKIRDL